MCELFTCQAQQQILNRNLRHFLSRLNRRAAQMRHDGQIVEPE